MAPPTATLKLPARLVDELGGQDVLSGRRTSRVRPGTRKDIRKAERVQKKALRLGLPPQKRLKLGHRGHFEADFSETAIIQPLRSKKPLAKKFDDSSLQPKSILKRGKKTKPESPEHSRSHSTSPSANVSRAAKIKLAEDDEEISVLEKKLGLKGKKGLPQSFKDDGLDVLLGGLDDVGNTRSQQERNEGKADVDEWLRQKRKRARVLAGSKTASEVAEADSGLDDDNTGSDMLLDSTIFHDNVWGEDSTGDARAVSPSTNVRRNRENPYIAPGGAIKSGKYILPSLRKPSSSDSEVIDRIRRQTQGLINKLTESNLISILGEVEKLYREHARQHVTSTLVDLILTSVCEPTSLPDSLIILHAGFIAATYKIIGTDFGAQVIQKTVSLFNNQYERANIVNQGNPAVATSTTTKETSNLITLVSELYNFQVIGSNLIFDYIRLFLGKLSELNAELLLKIIRTSGPQLRQDDPSALKDIVTSLRPAVAAVGEENISVRTKFMLETINDLKNNRMKTNGAASAITSEHTIRMKKTLGALNSRSIRASEPIRVGLKDIQESDEKGKWWLVGASWSGAAAEESSDSVNDEPDKTSLDRKEDARALDFIQLAREQRMNTDIRRAIFITIMSASDYQNAYLALLKLKLKRVQQLEIPKVLIHCSSAEKCYNPYYALIAKRLCGDKRLKMAFQFNLWDLFKKMGESEHNDDASEDEEKDLLDTRQVVNLSKMFGTLIVDGGLALSVLKNLNLTYLKPKTKIFMEVLLITILLQSQRNPEARNDEKAVQNIFAKVKDTPRLVGGLIYFLTKVVSKTDIAGGKVEKSVVKWASIVAVDTLVSLISLDPPKD